MWPCAVRVDENRDVGVDVFIAAIVILQMGSEDCKGREWTSQW